MVGRLPMLGPSLMAVGAPSNLLPAREQMAFTLGFHIVLVPFGVAFTFLMMVANYRGIRHDDRDALVLAQRRDPQIGDGENKRAGEHGDKGAVGAEHRDLPFGVAVRRRSPSSTNQGRNACLARPR